MTEDTPASRSSSPPLFKRLAVYTPLPPSAEGGGPFAERMVEDILSHRNSIFPSRKASPQSAKRLTASSAEEAKNALTRTASTKKSDGKSHQIFDVLLTHAACPRRLCQPPWTQPSISETRPTHRRNQAREKAHLKRQLLFGRGGLGERRFSQRSGLSPRISPKTSLGEGARGRGLL